MAVSDLEMRYVINDHFRMKRAKRIKASEMAMGVNQLPYGARLFLEAQDRRITWARRWAFISLFLNVFLLFILTH